jgi:hypothetical protein
MDKKGCIGVLVWMLLIFICGIILIAFGSCRSIKYVPIETIKHDSVYITQHQKDSIYIHDSIYQKEKGDTVLIVKWHTRYIEKQVRDTLIQIQRDTIPQPYPYEVEVPAQLSWWQKTRMHIGEITIIALLVLLGSWIVRIKW